MQRPCAPVANAKSHVLLPLWDVKRPAPLPAWAQGADLKLPWLIHIVPMEGTPANSDDKRAESALGVVAFATKGGIKCAVTAPSAAASDPLMLH